MYSLIHLNRSLMRISKSVLQAVAVAVTVTALATACTDSAVGPNGEKTTKNKTVDPCPACGMG